MLNFADRGHYVTPLNFTSSTVNNRQMAHVYVLFMNSSPGVA